MVSNKVKRNFSLILFIVGVALVIMMSIDLATGTDREWWELVSNIAVTAFFRNRYIDYRKAVGSGNLYGRVKL